MFNNKIYFKSLALLLGQTSYNVSFIHCNTDLILSGVYN